MRLSEEVRCNLQLATCNAVMLIIKKRKKFGLRSGYVTHWALENVLSLQRNSAKNPKNNVLRLWRKL